MLNGVDVKLKLVPSKDSFNLMAHDGMVGYKSVIPHDTLVVRKAKLNLVISLAHEKALLRGNAKYPLWRVTLKTFSVPIGMLFYTQDNLFLSQTPTQIVIGILTSSAFNGLYKANPFNFQTFYLTYLNVTTDGRTVSGKPLSLNYTNNQYVRAFIVLNLAMGLVDKVAGNDIEYTHFKDGYALYAFDLSPSLLDGDQFKMSKPGLLSFELKFATTTAEPAKS
jgi:hypothetical protein